MLDDVVLLDEELDRDEDECVRLVLDDVIDVDDVLVVDEEIPKSRIIVHAVIGHFLQTGERLYEKDRAMCDEPMDYGHYGQYVPVVGGFRAETGLHISSNSVTFIWGGLPSEIVV